MLRKSNAPIPSALGLSHDGREVGMCFVLRPAALESGSRRLHLDDLPGEVGKWFGVVGREGRGPVDQDPNVVGEFAVVFEHLASPVGC